MWVVSIVFMDLHGGCGGLADACFVGGPCMIRIGHYWSSIKSNVLSIKLLLDSIRRRGRDLDDIDIQPAELAQEATDEVVDVGSGN